MSKKATTGSATGMDQKSFYRGLGTTTIIINRAALALYVTLVLFRIIAHALLSDRDIER
jgi:hypothetical protein